MLSCDSRAAPLSRKQKHTVDVVHFEDEAHFIFGTFTAVQLDALHKLGEGDTARTVFVEQFEHTFGEERLQRKYRIRFLSNSFRKLTITD